MRPEDFGYKPREFHYHMEHRNTVLVWGDFSFVTNGIIADIWRTVAASRKREGNLAGARQARVNASIMVGRGPRGGGGSR
jgi:hypothetical protein